MNSSNISLPVPLPDNFETQNENTKQNIINYLVGLNIIEQKAYCIGIKHLGSSFNLLKSNGYNDWVKKQKQK